MIKIKIPETGYEIKEVGLSKNLGTKRLVVVTLYALPLRIDSLSPAGEMQEIDFLFRDIQAAHAKFQEIADRLAKNQ